MRRTEKQIRGRRKLLDLLDKGDFVTIALCKDDTPYLVTVNHCLDRKEECIYFHCAREGKKLDYIKANPVVWGQVMEESGPDRKECSWKFRTVMFSGKVRVIEEEIERRRALDLLIARLSSRPVQEKRALTEESLRRVAIGRIDLEEITGKESPAKKS